MIVSKWYLGNCQFQITPNPNTVQISLQFISIYNKITNISKNFDIALKWILVTPLSIYRLKQLSSSRFSVINSIWLMQWRDLKVISMVQISESTPQYSYVFLPSEVTNLSEIKRFLMEQTVQMTLFPEEGIFMNIYLISFTFLRFYFKLCSPL